MSEPLTPSTYDRLLEGIASGKYLPASRLMNLTLANRLGERVAPVREAPLGKDFDNTMTFSSVVRLKDGAYLGMYHGSKVMHTVSWDGGSPGHP